MWSAPTQQLAVPQWLHCSGLCLAMSVMSLALADLDAGDSDSPSPTAPLAPSDPPRALRSELKSSAFKAMKTGKPKAEGEVRVVSA